MYINSIYIASEGEGIHIGIPQIFVRMQGCDVHCHNCDTDETWDFDESKIMSLTEIMQAIDLCFAEPNVKLIKRVSLTGGDPLALCQREGLMALIARLKKEKNFLNLEVDGLKIEKDVFDKVDFIGFDYKTPSSGVKANLDNIIEINKLYFNQFQIKSVVANMIDFDFVYAAYVAIKKNVGEIMFPWVLTPAFTPNQEFSLKWFATLLQLNQARGGPFRVIGQQHKWIHGAGRRSV